MELLLLGGDGSRWSALARPARKLRAGDVLSFESLSATVVEVADQWHVTVELAADGDLERAIAETGSVPYPPYVTHGPEDSTRYQTIYGDRIGSAAAPTAGLHFTSELLGRLRDRGVNIAQVHLEIGLDTFRPISIADVADHQMHSERFDISTHAAEAVAQTKRIGGRVTAVGTTVVRALESAADSSGTVVPGKGVTDLFITPGYRRRVVDGLVTNFHMPRSTLLVMVAALYPDWRSIYQHALSSGYRFLSFGDAMYIPRIR